MNNVEISFKEKTTLRKQVFKFLSEFGDKIGAKLNNVCSKTGSYSVPSELFQKRTSRKNRCLISWKTIKKNNLTLEQLNTFDGGVVVEFVNNDFFDEANSKNPLFIELKNRLGSNENVSAIITIRSEEGDSSSKKQREAFKKLTDNAKIKYNGRDVIITEKNFKKYAISQDKKGKGQGNETWSGFLYVSIRGGQQDTIQTHAGKELTLFNPACEYASKEVIEDINLVMAYYAMICLKSSGLEGEQLAVWSQLIAELENALKTIEYDNSGYKGNLYDAARKQYSVTFIPGQLTDPIQIREITIDKFNIPNRTVDSLDVTHIEAVENNQYYWDKNKKCILSPARPNNLFWSYHLSNMMQQNFDLDEYFEEENNRYNRRKKLIEKSK